jgi:HK97 gp10 family phage protein
MGMAKVNIKMPEEFLSKVSRLANQTDVILPKVLEAGGEMVLNKVKGNLNKVVGSETKYSSRSTGELLASLGLSDAKQDRDGNFNVKVGFAEPRSDGESNAKIASIIEYGKHGQPAKPFLKPARTASKKPCMNAMIAKLEEEIDKI